MGIWVVFIGEEKYKFSGKPISSSIKDNTNTFYKELAKKCDYVVFGTGNEVIAKELLGEFKETTQIVFLIQNMQIKDMHD